MTSRMKWVSETIGQNQSAPPPLYLEHGQDLGLRVLISLRRPQCPGGHVSQQPSCSSNYLS